MKKNSFVYGALILGLASIICKILGAIFKIPLTYLVGSNGIGIYQLVYPIFALFLVICTSGIPVAISKIVSRENVNKNYINIKKIVKISFRLMLVLGIILAFLIIIFSGVISSFQGNSEISVCYLILAPSIIICSCISIFRGYFQGFEIMKFSAISQIIEQLFKLIFGLSFAYFFLSFGLIYGVFGAFLGLTLSELIALMYLFIVYKKKNLKIDFSYNKDKILSNFECAKIVIKESVPITLCSVLIPITVVVDSFIIIKLLNLSGFNFEISSSLYGLESGIVGSIINLPCVIAISLGISLMPAISASFASNNTKEISFKIKLALKIIWYFSLPCIIIFAIFSKEICYFLYGNLSSEFFEQINIVSIMLRLSSFSILYISLNNILTTMLQSLNKSYYTFFVLLIACSVRVVLSVFLVMNKNITIYGLILSDVICYSFASLFNLIKLKSLVKFNFNKKEIIFVPLISLSVMTLSLVFFKVLIMKTLSRTLTILSIGISLVIYVLFVLLLKGFNLKELNNTKLLKFIKRKKY